MHEMQTDRSGTQLLRGAMGVDLGKHWKYYTLTWKTECFVFVNTDNFTSYQLTS